MTDLTFGEIVDESEPLIGAVPAYGPPVAFVAIPWLLFGLMLAGPFAVIATVVVLLLAVAAGVVLIGAILASPWLLVRRLRRHRGPRAFPALGHAAVR
jgi:hypothetical protein